jgi:hypothetical protein
VAVQINQCIEFLLENLINSKTEQQFPALYATNCLLLRSQQPDNSSYPKLDLSGPPRSFCCHHVTFRILLAFDGGELLASHPRSTHKLEGNPFLFSHNILISIFSATVHILRSPLPSVIFGRPKKQEQGLSVGVVAHRCRVTSFVMLASFSGIFTTEITVF